MKNALLLLLCLSFLPIARAQEEKVLKRKVAIGRFSNSTKNAQSVFYDSENDPLAQQAADILATKLIASEKFLLIERQDYDKIVKELELTNTVSQTIGADYLIIGSITEIGRKTVGTQKLFSSKVKQVVEAGISLRLVDVSTGLNIYSAESKGESQVEDKRVMGFGEKADFDATLYDKAISAAMDKMVETIIKTCMDKPWQAFILGKQDESYIISGGKSQGIEVGDIYMIESPGKEVKNPQTGIMVELPGTEIAKIKVDITLGNTVQDEISLGTIIEGEIDDSQLDTYRIKELSK